MGRNKKFSLEELFDATEQLLLSVGYEGFTVGLVAEQLNVSRAAIYKYYTNKEALIADFMVERMASFMEEIEHIPQQQSFQLQIDYLLSVIFRSKDLHQVLSYAHAIHTRGDRDIEQKIQQLNSMHRHMYAPMQKMIEQGKLEGILKAHIPNDLILSFIFQSISIPNHTRIDETQFLAAVKEMIFSGISIQK